MASSHRRARSPSPDAGLDFFSDSLSSLFAHHVPAHGEPDQLFTYTPPASTSTAPITVRLPPQAVNSLFAHHAWDGGLRLADKLALGELDVAGEDVLELGAGAGISGLMAARMGAKRVVLSDYNDPTLIANLRSNIDLAFPSPADAPIRASLSAQGHSWGDTATYPALLSSSSFASPSSTREPERRFTRIILADTLWSSAGHVPLLDSLFALLAPTPTARVCIVAGLHSGRATIRSFLRKASGRGLVREGKWVEVGIEGRRREWGWDERGRTEGGAAAAAGADEWDEVEDASERNKWVVEGQLEWSDEALLARKASGTKEGSKPSPGGPVAS
ncbi:uncharacterized protein RHOBADRAFT_51504 [Rhodotorula graminis WP1]|uniref:Nicotinamide N-methyltransferase n=1 Tax=Rhodotorula graminis (strain WP1) TaxID=578459 RepID=A0A194SB53_RHOGW|nr:uncharacterized protein RHOBADRAFT_51504 [Rhodotorula graminis WP1]KPV77685.1 hypothetical protein RHOBADRAFT_51504 [Rhodotorula graminis WP1]